MSDELIKVLVQAIPAPALVVIAGIWMREKLTKIDKLTDVISKLDSINEKLVRLESNVERLENKREVEREEFIHVKSKVDAAWRAIDKLQLTRSQ